MTQTQQSTHGQFGPYVVDQFGTIWDKDRNKVTNAETPEAYKEYYELTGMGYRPEQIVIKDLVEIHQPVSVTRRNAILELRNRLDSFVAVYKERFPEAEIASFADKVAQATDWLKNGDNEFNAPLKLEAELLKLTRPEATVETVVSDIMFNYGVQRLMIPFVSARRQALTEQINLLIFKFQMEDLLRDVVPSALTQEFQAYAEQVKAAAQTGE